MLILVHSAVEAGASGLEEVALVAERTQLGKRIWRGLAADGQEFGFELSAPLRHGDVILVAEGKRYVVQQQPEAVVEISLEIAPSAAAGIGWAVGNLHLELSAESNRLLAPNEPATRALLGRLQVPFTETKAIFRPGRFARGVQPSHDLGPSHRH